MKKRIVSLLLCIVMLVSLLSVNAFAAEGIKLTAQKVEAELTTGATVKVAINITENPGIVSGKVTVNYDSTALEFVKADFLATAKGLGDSGDSNLNKPGVYVLIFGNDTSATANTTFTGKAFELTFKVLDGATAQEYPITLTTSTKYDFLDLDANGVAFQADNGSITLKAKPVKVKSVTVSPKTLSLEVGTTGTLTATVTPSNATEPVIWTSDKESVATVDQDGKVIAMGEGTATITAAAGKNKKATCTVTVTQPACKHEANHAVAGKASTCVERGYRDYYECRECGAVVDVNGHPTEIEYLPLAPHQLTPHDAVPATCTTDGTEAYWTCEVCPHMFSDENGTNEIKKIPTVSALGHEIADDAERVTEVAPVAGKQIGLYSTTCTRCPQKLYSADLLMPENTINVIAKQSDKSKKDFSKAVTFGIKASDSDETLKFTIDPVTDAIVDAAKKAGYKVTGSEYDGAYSLSIGYFESASEVYEAMQDFLKDGVTFTQTISAKEKTWAADAKSHTMTFDINTENGTFTVKVDGKDENTITFTNTFTYRKKTGGGSTTTTDDTTKTDGKKVESGKTFDAGIAMYVGLSVLSVTGGALVIGKKKHF